MIDMCMGKYYTIYFTRIKKKAAIADKIFLITTLEHSAVQEDFKSIIQGQQMTAPGNLTCCSAKGDLHDGLNLSWVRYGKGEREKPLGSGKAFQKD
jgi:hypothetical protein